MIEDKFEKLRILFKACQSGNFDEAKEILAGFEKPQSDFSGFINDYIESHSQQKSKLLFKANISVKYGYKILNGTKHTNDRNLILRLCIAMDMEVNDIQKALSLNKMLTLDISNARDSLIMCALNNHSATRLDEIDDWLKKLSYEPLFDKI